MKNKLNYFGLLVLVLLLTCLSCTPTSTEEGEEEFSKNKTLVVEIEKEEITEDDT